MQRQHGSITGRIDVSIQPGPSPVVFAIRPNSLTWRSTHTRGGGQLEERIRRLQEICRSRSVTARHVAVWQLLDEPTKVFETPRMRR